MPTCTAVIKVLDHNSWDASELESSRARMKAAARSLVLGGAKSFEKKKSNFDVFNIKLEIKVNSVHDDWEWRLLARAKTVSVSQGIVERLPWDVLVVGQDDPLDGGWMSSTALP